MSESWKQWERQIVNSRFLLQRYLGGSEHSAVFLTERGIPPQKIAIKFIQVDEPDAQLQLSRWQHAAKLSHPHLLRNFESGRCRLGDFDLLYVLMEYAEENLSQFLSQRPLTPAEARDVLTPALQALAFLHGEGLVHRHVRPSNILAIEDQLKLSSDGISSFTEHAAQSHLPAAETQQSAAAASLRHPSPYDAPEVAKGIISPAGFSRQCLRVLPKLAVFSSLGWYHAGGIIPTAAHSLSLLSSTTAPLPFLRFPHGCTAT